MAANMEELGERLRTALFTRNNDTAFVWHLAEVETISADMTSQIDEIVIEGAPGLTATLGHVVVVHAFIHQAYEALLSAQTEANLWLGNLGLPQGTLDD
ncbi:MAG TPA: hypothetical protein VMR45_02760 [Patescibacteria group bacterium]|nr:hypothetical protein [Patescibacteria group bacterium]